MFLLDSFLPVPAGVVYASLLGVPIPYYTYTILLLGLALNYLVNLALAAVVLKLAKKSLQENILKLLLWIAITTTLIYVVELFDLSIGIFAGFAMFALYYLVFTKKFGLSEKQAVAGALAFAILTNPFLYMLPYLFAPPIHGSNTALRNACSAALVQQSTCYTTKGDWNPNGHIYDKSAIATCLNVSENDKHVTNGSCENCGFCFDDIRNPTYVCCGPQPT